MCSSRCRSMSPEFGRLIGFYNLFFYKIQGSPVPTPVWVTNEWLGRIDLRRKMQGLAVTECLPVHLS